MKPRKTNVKKKSISFTAEQMLFVEERSKMDYLGAGGGYRRSVSGFIQSLIEKDRRNGKREEAAA